MFIRLPAVVASMFGLIVGILSSSFAWVAGWSIAVAFACLIDVAMALPPRKIQIHRDADATTRTGSPVAVRFTVTNRSQRHAIGEFRDAWVPSAGVTVSRHAFAIPKAERRTVHTSMVPTRTGTLHSKFVVIRTIGPLRFAGRQKSFESPWTLRVLPPFHSRRVLPSRIRMLRELDGRSLLLVRGEGTEFDSLREYVAGDDVRAIDWRSTARLGETVVRTWLPERDRHVIVVLDSGRAGSLRIGDAPAFDSFIETALLCAALASKTGDRIATISADSKLRSRYAADHSSAVLHELSESLADVEPRLTTTNWTQVLAEIRHISPNPALVVILTSIGTGTVSADFMDAVQRLAAQCALIIGAPQRYAAHPNLDTADGVYELAALERAELEEDALRTQLTKAGAHVMSAPPEHLPAKIADAYVELKAHGKL